MLQVSRRPGQEESLKMPAAAWIRCVAVSLGLTCLTSAAALGAPAPSAPASSAAAAASAPTPPAPAPTSTPAPSPAPAKEAPAAVPVPEILKRAEEAASFIRALDAKLPADAQITRIESQLPQLSERLA